MPQQKRTSMQKVGFHDIILVPEGEEDLQNLKATVRTQMEDNSSPLSRSLADSHPQSLSPGILQPLESGNELPHSKVPTFC